VTAHLVASSSGPARKYYRPTSAGYQALRDGTAAWRLHTGIVDAVLDRRLPRTPAAAQ
jgi:PadR family transcriptional regulator PadR